MATEESPARLRRSCGAGQWVATGEWPEVFDSATDGRLLGSPVAGLTTGPGESVEVIAPEPQVAVSQTSSSSVRTSMAPSRLRATGQKRAWKPCTRSTSSRLPSGTPSR